MDLASKALLFYLRRFPIDYRKNKLAKMVDLKDVMSPLLHRTCRGEQFRVNLDDYTMRNIYLYDGIERNTIQCLRKLCRPAMNFIDCGANIGFYTVVMAKLLSKGTVHAFEPVKASYSRLLESVQLNALDNVVCNNIGLYEKSCSMEIGLNFTHMGANSLCNVGNSEAKEEVALTTLDEYCERNAIDHVDALKIDVEGAEISVLRGASKIIDKSKKMVAVLEMVAPASGSNAGQSASEAFEVMRSKGFKAYLPKGWPFRMIETRTIPPNYSDNMLFLKGYDI